MDGAANAGPTHPACADLPARVRDGVAGFGGQADFVAGALHSPGGHAVVALHSWHEKSETSSVLPVLTNPVTSFQHSAIVSDQGCAEIFGQSEGVQAKSIIENVADPRAREQLMEAAGTLGLLRVRESGDQRAIRP